MTTRTNIKNELTFYGFRGTQITRPNWNAIATQLGVRPTAQRYSRINDNSPKNRTIYKEFVRQVKSNIQQKYTRDNENIIQSYSFTARIRYKTGKGWSNWATKTFNRQVQGKRINIMDKIQRDQEQQILELRESDIDLDEDSISDLALNDATVVPITTGGKLVSKGVRVARMRQTGAFQLDYNYIGDTSWDRQENTCVFDYLFHKYAGKSGFKKSLPSDDRERAYEFLEGLFGENSLSEGVCIDQLEEFCVRFDVGMIALDKTEQLITYKKAVGKNNAPLIFIISNNHFYPIEDKSKRLSVSAQNREADKPDEEKQVWRSEDYEFENKGGSSEPSNIKYPIKYPEENDPEGNDYAVKVITELNTLPVPKSLRVEENKIISFKIGDTTYLTEKPNEEVVKYCGDDFKGQTVNSILMDTWKEVKQEWKWGDDWGDITSRVNPLVHKTLNAVNVKNRTHYGTTRQLDDPFFELLPAMSVKFKYLAIEKKPYKNIFTGETMYETKEKIKYHRVVFPRKTRYEQQLIDGDIIGLDINKCYASCLQNPYDNWIRYDLEDTWEEYDGELKTGLYFVETNDLTLLHQTNIYSNKILEKAIEEQIPLVIKKQLIHKPKLIDEQPIPKNHFEPLIQTIKEKTRGTGLGKLLINMITGYLGKTEKTKRTAELDTDLEAVWRHYVACEKPELEVDFERYFFKEEFAENGYTRFHKDNLIFNNICPAPSVNFKYITNNGTIKYHRVIFTHKKFHKKPIFLYGYETRECKNEYTLPMYLQILDWANIRLYELGKKIGGEAIYRHTDSVVSIGGKLPTRDLTNCWGDYSVERKKWNFKSTMKTDRAVEIKEFENSWGFNPALKTSNDWRDIINYAIDKGGLLIEGRAGTGKSYVPKSAFQADVLKLNENTKTMSFTNKASRNIQGTTIHKTFHITKTGTIPRKTMSGLKKYKYFIIDEIGMISSELWKYLMLLKKDNPKAIFILLGDYRQLPPIEQNRNVETDIFNHPVVKYLCNNNRIELTEKQRYDEGLWDFLEKGYETEDWNGLEERPIDFAEIYNGKNICYYNRTRVDINKRCMDYFKIQAQDPMYLGFTPKQVEIDGVMKDDPTDRRQSVYIYNDLPVMSWKNSIDLGIVNSEEFRVLDYDDETIILTRDEGGEDIEIETVKFHDYFIPNYCSTAHKSQGATYKGKVLLWDWNTIKQDKHLAYTACSRATALEKLVVATGIKKG